MIRFCVVFSPSAPLNGRIAPGFDALLLASRLSFGLGDKHSANCGHSPVKMTAARFTEPPRASQSGIGVANKKHISVCHFAKRKKLGAACGGLVKKNGLAWLGT